MNRFAIGLCAVSIVFPVLLHAQPQVPEKIVVGCGNFRPMFFESQGGAAGRDVDLWRLWSHKTGIEVEYRVMQWSEVIPALLNHEIDVVNGATFTPERAKQMAFTKPHQELLAYLFYHESIPTPRSLADLRGYTVGVLKGSSIEEYLRQNLPKAQIIPLPNYEILAVSAMQGRIKAFVAEEPLISYYLTLTGGANAFRRSTDFVLDSSLCMAVRLEDQQLLNKINEGFDAITENEVLQIDKGWFGAERTADSKWHLWLFVIAGIGVALLVMITFARVWDRELENIQVVRQKFLNLWIVFAAVMVVPVCLNSLMRAFEFGWQPLYTFHLCIGICVIIFAIFRNRIHYYLRTLFVLLGLYLLGLGGLMTYGIVGATNAPLMTLVIVAVILFGMKVGIVAIIVSLVTIGGIAIAFQLELLHPGFDVVAYSLSFTTWFTVFVFFAFYTIAAGLGIAGIYRHMEEALHARQKSESLFRNLVETTSDLIWEINATGEFVYCSPQTETILGYKQEEFLGKKFYAFLPEQEKQQLIKMFQSYASAGKPFSTLENANLHKNGQRVILESSGVPIVDDSGKLVGYRGVARDITERKKAEAERERLMVAVEQAVESIIITDASMKVLYANPAFETITGYDRGEALGITLGLLKSDEHDTVIDEIRDAVASGKPWSGRMQNKRKEGTPYTAEVVFSPVRDAAGTLINYIIIQRDITNEMALEEQLRQSQKMEAIGQLAGGVAHDFNNLLQAIIGYSDLAIGEVNEKDPLYNPLDEIMKASLRASTLVRQLLAFSRRQVLEMRDINLNEVVDNLIKMIRRVIGEHITLAVHDSGDLGAVRADAGQIEQILMNLCVNARDAMPKGGAITIKTGNVSLDEDFCEANNWDKPGRYVCLSVADTGCGIDEETRSKIFEPFFTTKEVGKGTGLGLATVYGIVKQHDGLIQVLSTVGKGTTFNVYFPLVERSAATAQKQEKGPAPGGVETILVAEDDAIVSRLAKTILERSGYTVFIADDGVEAMALFQKHADDISLALLDVIMPKMSGLAVFERIRKCRPELCVLFSSGYSIDTVHAGVIFDEHTQMIQKPYHPDDLLRKVRQVLDGKN